MSRWDALSPDKSSSKRDQKNNNNYKSSSSPSLHERLLKTIHDAQDLDSILSGTARLLVQSDRDDDPTAASPKMLGETVEILLSLSPRCVSRNAAQVLRLVSDILNKKSVLLSSQQTATCLNYLCLLDIHNDTNAAGIECIAAFISSFHKQLPAEQVAHDIVQPMLLKALQRTSDQSATLIYDALNALLRDPQHASAMLAPLTTHINDRGQEQTMSNPVGVHLLSLLESKLPTSQVCLTFAVQAIRNVGSPLSPNMVIVEKSLLLSLRDDPDNSLRLLQAVLQTYPTAMRNLLVESASTLVDLLPHPLAAHCCADIITNMPLQQWMDPNKTKGSMQYFGQRLVDCFFRLTTTLLQHKDLPPLKLCTVILTTIPYTQDSILATAAVDLLERILNAIMDNNSTNSTNDAISSCVVHCMGGKVLPSGERTKMVVPMQLYLAKDDASGFQHYLWNACLDDARRKNAIDIVGARLSVDPDWVRLNPQEWDLFQEVVQSSASCDNPRTRADGFVLLEKFFAARKDKYKSATMMDSQSVSFVFDLLLTFTLDKMPTVVLVPMLGIYSSMTAMDWEYLFHNNLGWQHVDYVLTISHTGDATVRAFAAKACGELCTSCLDKPSRYQQPLCTKVTAVMTKCLKDKNTNVRSMAAFCIGNLALAIRGQSLHIMLSDVCDTTIHLVGETNGKVVNNAIRALGHLIFLVLHGPPMDWNVSAFYRRAVIAMNLKVMNAIDLMKAQRSWKERSNAKKHAWGACNALALMLDGPDAIRDDTINVSRKSLQLLVRCLDSTNSETEKIPLAAANAVARIPTESLQVLAHRNGLVGLAIVECVGTLLDATASRSPASKLTVATADLLRHLLAGVSILDATHVLKLTERARVEFLYDWMIDHNVSAEAFEAFALAFVTCSGSISLEQRFASRALERHRHHTANEIDETEMGVDPFDDSEEDEL
jgi:hypothetical protein